MQQSASLRGGVHAVDAVGWRLTGICAAADFGENETNHTPKGGKQQPRSTTTRTAVEIPAHPLCSVISLTE
eukprot:COSAG01_NODE_5926_length_3948_cov_2.087555_3_plen_71_part_00